MYILAALGNPATLPLILNSSCPNNTAARNPIHNNINIYILFYFKILNYQYPLPPTPPNPLPPTPPKTPPPPNPPPKPPPNPSPERPERPLPPIPFSSIHQNKSFEPLRSITLPPRLFPPPFLEIKEMITNITIMIKIPLMRKPDRKSTRL